jgi:uncharacterized membrane protein YfcA
MSFYLLGLTFAIIWAASFLFAMLGLGGGMVYVPVMKWLGLDFRSVAIPLGLLLNGLNTALAMIPFHKAGLIDYKGALPFALSAIVFAPIGAHVVQFLPTRVILILFVVAVLVAAIKVFISSRAPDVDNVIEFKKRLIYGGFSGALIGFMGGMLGIGGGFLAAPILMSMGYSAKRAAATTAYVVTFSSASGFLGHVAEGHFDPTLTLVLVAAVLLGSQLGAHFTVKKAKPKMIKRVYAVILIIIAIKLTLGLLSIKL